MQIVFKGHLALPKIVSARGLLRKRIFQEDEYADFVANYAVINNMTEKHSPAGYIFKRNDNHIVLRRQISNQVRIPELVNALALIMIYMRSHFYRVLYVTSAGGC